jgi:hypothetical protein
MTTEAQILANRRLGRRIVLNLGHFDFEIVSDFNHSGCFMQNKPNFQNGKMNASSAITMNYEQLTMNYTNKNKPNTKPIKPNTNPIQTQFTECSNERNFCYNKVL